MFRVLRLPASRCRSSAERRQLAAAACLYPLVLLPNEPQQRKHRRKRQLWGGDPRRLHFLPRSDWESQESGRLKQPSSDRIRPINRRGCFHPDTLTRGRRRVRDALWPHARACSVHRAANVRDRPPRVCVPHRHLPPDRAADGSDPAQQGRWRARYRERIQSSISHPSSFISYYATILSLFDPPTLGAVRLGLWGDGGGGANKFKTKLTWKLKQKSAGPHFCANKKLGVFY